MEGACRLASPLGRIPSSRCKQSPEELRVLLLSVHPSAWSSSPPELPSSLSDSPELDAELAPASRIANPSTSAVPTPTFSYRSTPFLSAPDSTYGYFPQAAAPPPNPLTYVLFRHNNALLALMRNPLVVDSDPAEMEAYRGLAIETVNRFGWSWPAILDAEFPEPSSDTEGVKYERTTIR